MPTQDDSIFKDSNYELIDFGDGEKLERFGETIVRRETTSVYGTREEGNDWDQDCLRCELDGRNRSWLGEPAADWRARFGELVFQLKPTPTGQVGVFPEQAHNWNWIKESPLNLDGLKALNLFGYTGGTTMALAKRGVHVVHCDSAKSVVNWAKSNAELSGLSEAPIRWMVEDAMTFVNREIKRGNQYDIVVADPPSFGRGPKGESWKIQKDFSDLLNGLKQLTAGRLRMMLISCHTPEFDERALRTLVANCFSAVNVKSRAGESFRLSIPAANEKRLDSGCCFRWSDI